ncbi:MAG: hypothetical protein GY873_29165 [Bosea sp.]|uniref:hypothetical protein n=1 Tax=Bosea sp. (in: a-proteobacteria) TaxID=1871050 RepID=UPI0023851A01|nr:hypothetical protein [Bosea sp. (in: a-proteobacteria)]
MTRSFAFFLGGHDLEMVTIRDLLREQSQQVVDHGFRWGAKASAYGREIAQTHDDGQVPVLVEPEPDIPLPAGTVLVDHHGTRAGEPSALLQVFRLLGLPDGDWSRRFQLVSANDTGHAVGLRAAGTNDAEIRSIRAEDRRAQGITPEQDRAGLTALSQAARWPGGVLVVQLPHTHAATVTDPLAMASGHPPDLLIVTPEGRNFFGSGERIARLDRAFPGGWTGGDLLERGYWGISQVIDESMLQAALLARS